LRPRDVVTFLIPNGVGRHGQEFKVKRGRVVIALPTHVVVNSGGRHGTPYVVDENNHITPAPKRGWFSRFITPKN
jgi:hypothetical protein